MDIIRRLEKLLDYRPKIITPFRHFYIRKMEELIKINKIGEDRKRNFRRALLKAGHVTGCPVLRGLADTCPEGTECVNYRALYREHMEDH